MAGKEQQIVIKKVRKAGHGGAHGGAWKVAYADFVTAMMAFFLVMWLMGSDEEIKASIEHYFNHPNTPYHMGRDPNSDTARPLGEEDGSGMSILKGINGIIEQKDPIPSARSWEIEHGNWRVKVEGALKKHKIYGIQSTENSVKFSINEAQIFVPGSANFKPGAGEILDDVVRSIKDYRGHFIVTAHTATRAIASDEYSTGWELSAMRSSMILRYMTEKHGIDPAKLSAIGFADQRPLVDNVNERARNFNSRIEFILSRKAPAL
jgi:chemotaxis protein MotB